MTSAELAAKAPKAKRVSHPAMLVDQLRIVTRGGDMRDITRDLNRWCKQNELDTGLLTLFLQHTSASLIVQEHVDPTVKDDLLSALDRLVPEDYPYTHGAEGSDDMPAHIRTMLTGVNVAIPVRGGKLMLGRWQGVFMIEHRSRPLQRDVALHYAGTAHAAEPS